MFRPVILFTLSLAPVAAFARPAGTSTVLFAPPPAMTPIEIPNAPAPPKPRTTQWSIGAPTNEEQYYLELINRARANPAAEGARLAATTDPDIVTAYDYWNVDLALMQAELSALKSAPPIAMNEKLLLAARAHSLDQFNASFQGHTGSNGSTVSSRVIAAGYSASFVAENVFAQARSTLHGHAGFEVDWGTDAGGMQDGRGHRAIIHAGYREAGIGLYWGNKGSGANAFGPQVVTQDFAVMAGTLTPFVTGVAYYDFNSNNFYDPGEGIGGITVNVDGASYHAVTSASGGYAVPVPLGAAVRRVTFSTGDSTGEGTASLTGTNNFKVDFKPVPVVDGPVTPVVSLPSTYSVKPVPGASSYSWRAIRKTSALPDNANDLTRVNTSTTAGYSVINTAVKQEGSGSYHLAQPASQPRNETITYKSAFRGGAAPSLQFQSRLRTAKTEQRAYVQISFDGGTTWTTVDSQPGSGGSGDAAFTRRTVPLAAAADRDFLLRFNFAVAGTNYSTSTGDSAGWFIDAVTFTDVIDTAGAAVNPIPSGNTFIFAPVEPAAYLLTGRSTVAGRTLDFGPAREVTAVPPVTFASWAAAMETSAGLPAGSLAGAPGADHNRDGIPNLMAFALDLSPVSSATASLPQTVVSGGALRLDYPKRLDRTGITVKAEISADLTTWFAAGQSGAPAGFADTVVSTEGSVETHRASVPVGAQDYYLRLKVTQP